MRASEQDREDVRAERQEYKETMDQVEAAKLVFLDETAINTSMVRLYGWAPRGERACGHVPYGSWERLTVLGALSVRGTEGVMTIAGGTTRDVFEAYLSHVLLPSLKNTHPTGAILVLDNLSSHKGERIETLVRDAGFTLKYLPRYSPDLSPLELCWSKLKEFLRRAEARTVAALDQALAAALDAITAEDAQGWFQHCGYQVQSCILEHPALLQQFRVLRSIRIYSAGALRRCFHNSAKRCATT